MTDWLERWQAQFSQMLRTPLTTHTNTLRTDAESYPRALLTETLPGPHGSPGERLGVYNRQYWFRLLSVMHTELLLTARLLGLWHFNQYALRFLQAQPPRHHALQRIAEGFDAFLAESLPRDTADTAQPPRAALLEAAQLDLAFSRVFRAPAVPRLVLPGNDAAALVQLRLTPSPAYSRFTEHWPLIRLRHTCIAEPAERALPLSAAHAQPRHWVLFRNDHGVVNAPLTAAQARLYELLETLPLGAALAQLEHEAPPDLHEALPEITRRWLEQAVEHGYFHHLHAGTAPGS